MNTQKVCFSVLLVIAIVAVFWSVWYALLLHCLAGVIAFGFYNGFNRWSIAKTATVVVFMIMGFGALVATFPNKK